MTVTVVPSDDRVEGHNSKAVVWQSVVMCIVYAKPAWPPLADARRSPTTLGVGCANLSLFVFSSEVLL